MRRSIIIISIVVGMIVAALAPAIDSIGVVADVPERTVAARGRGVKGVNAKPTRRQRNKPARESREDVRVAGLYGGVRQAFRISKSAIEEAMYAVGVATPLGRTGLPSYTWTCLTATAGRSSTRSTIPPGGS